MFKVSQVSEINDVLEAAAGLIVFFLKDLRLTHRLSGLQRLVLYNILFKKANVSMHQNSCIFLDTVLIQIEL